MASWADYPWMPALSTFSEDTAVSPYADDGSPSLETGGLLFDPTGAYQVTSSLNNNDIYSGGSEDTFIPFTSVRHATLGHNVPHNAFTTQQRGYCWNDDGTELIICRIEDEEVRMLPNAGSAWNPGNDNLEGTGFETIDFTTLATSRSEPWDVCYTDGGKKLIVSGRNGGDPGGYLVTFTTSTPYDFSTLSESTNIDHTDNAILDGIGGFVMRSDGKKIWILDRTSEAIHEVTASTAWDFSTGTTTVSTLDLSTVVDADDALSGLTWCPSIKTLYVTAFDLTNFDTNYYVFTTTASEGPTFGSGWLNPIY